MLRASIPVIMKQEPHSMIDKCPHSLKSSVDLHHAIEVEELKAKLSEGNNRLLQFQKETSAAHESLIQENSKLQDDLNKLRDRYERLLDSHKKLQKNNHNLECNLLASVEKLNEDKTSLEKQVHTLTTQLLDAKLFISDLHETSERYRNDCNLAVQLLQCKPSTFMPQSLNALPHDVQSKVKNYFSLTHFLGTSNESSSSMHFRPVRVPIPTFPPTAVVYSTTDDRAGEVDEEVPISVIAQILAKPHSRIQRKGRVVVCSKCLSENVLIDASVQTDDGWRCVKDFTPNIHRTRVFTNPQALFPDFRSTMPSGGDLLHKEGSVGDKM